MVKYVRGTALPSPELASDAPPPRSLRVRQPFSSLQVVGLVHISEMREGRVGDPAAEVEDDGGTEPVTGPRGARGAQWSTMEWESLESNPRVG